MASRGGLRSEPRARASSEFSPCPRCPASGAQTVGTGMAWTTWPTGAMGTTSATRATEATEAQRAREVKAVRSVSMARRGSWTGGETTRVEVRPVDDSGVEMYATGEHRRDDRIVSTEMKVWWILV